MINILKQQAVFFDMDGLIIDSEPLWHQAELEVFAELGKKNIFTVDIPYTLGLRINEVVDLWYQESPWTGPSCIEIRDRIIKRAMDKIEKHKPLLPGVEQALLLAKDCGLKIGLASASPKFMLERVLEIFSLHHYFQAIISAEYLLYSKPHPEVYIRGASILDVDPIRCSSLEDSFNGMIATKAARMRSIVIPNKDLKKDHRWDLAQVKLSSLMDLKAVHIL